MFCAAIECGAECALVRTTDGPAGRPESFNPKNIGVYAGCPERYYWTYVKKLRMPEPFSAARLKGIATHSVLAEVLRYRMDGQPEPESVAELGVLAADRLKEDEYPEDQRGEWSHDVRDVAEWAGWSLDRLEPEARVVAVEREFDYRWGGYDFSARVDAVFEHLDGEIEHVDFKTGKAGWDHIQQVLSRVTVCAEYPERSVRTTFMYASQHTVDSRVMARETLVTTWPEIAGIVESICTTTEWPARPSGFCGFCRYRPVCSVHGTAPGSSQN